MSNKQGNPIVHTAFTLTELLMAIVITSLVGMSVATVSAVLSHAWSHSDSMIESISSARYAMMSIDADLRKAGLVTATGDGAGEMTLWTGDSNGDGRINIAEIVLIQPDGDAGNVERRQVVFPDSMSPEQLAILNVSIPLANLTDISAVRGYLSQGTYSAYLTVRVLATDVTSFEPITDAAAPMTQRVLLRISAGEVGQRITLTNSATLRADATGSIEWIEGVPVLQLPGSGRGHGDPIPLNPIPHPAPASPI